jgi:hypothetical protein
MKKKTIMTRWLLVGILIGYQTHAAEQLVHRAFCELTRPHSEKEVPCYADVVTNTETQATELRIYAEKGTEREAYKHRLEEGQEFVQSVGSIYLPGLGRVFYIDWQWGALSQGLTLYTLGADGRIKEAFRDGGIYGYRVVKMPDANSPKIVILDRDDADSSKVARIYTVTSNGEIRRESVRRSNGPFSFELKGSAVDPTAPLGVPR